MAINSPKRQSPQPEKSVIQWLLDSDPSIRWQVLRDLTDAPDKVIAAERASVATEGWGARLLALQGTDGRWGGVAWNRGWNSTMHVLMLLRDLGLDPACHQARRAVGLVRDGVTWKGCGPQECDANLSSLVRSSPVSMDRLAPSARTLARTSGASLTVAR